MRLFTALWPDAAALDEIDAALADVGADGPRWSARERRHVTLCFLADADPDVEEDRLRRAAEGLPAPRLRVAGAGTFPGVLWMGIETDAPQRLAGLVRAGGGDPAGFVAHLTVARTRRRTVPSPLAGLVGTWWTPEHVALVASGRPYRTLARVPLAPGGRSAAHR